MPWRLRRSVPVKLTVCGEPVALSAIDRDAVRVLAAAGLNSTETVQVAAAASEVVQVFAEIRKGSGVGPGQGFRGEESERRFREFLTVTTCAAVVDPTVVEAKVRVVGVSVTAGAAAALVPVRATVCGEPVPLSAIERDAVRVPAAAGLNSTETVQVAAAASVVVQVFAEIRKEVALVPVRVSEVRVRAVVPEFFTVTT